MRVFSLTAPCPVLLATTLLTGHRNRWRRRWWCLLDGHGRCRSGSGRCQRRRWFRLQHGHGRIGSGYGRCWLRLRLGHGRCGGDRWRRAHCWGCSERGSGCGLGRCRLRLQHGHRRCGSGHGRCWLGLQHSHGRRGRGRRKCAGRRRCGEWTPGRRDGCGWLGRVIRARLWLSRGRSRRSSKPRRLTRRFTAARATPCFEGESRVEYM